jgi:hypothetical protein
MYFMTKNYFSLKKWHNIFLSFKLLKYAILLFYIAISSITYGQYTYLTNTYTNAGHPGNINTDGDATSTGWTTLITGPTTANSWSATTPIGFPFNFYGVPVTDFKISGNGVLTFSTAATAIPSSNNTNLPAGATENIPDLSILGFWDSYAGDGATQSGDNIYYKVFGTAPNRQLWIKYFSYEYGSNGSGGSVCSFAYWGIAIEESTDKVYVVDFNYHTGGANLTSTIGVQNNATSAVQIGTNMVFMGAGSTGIPDNDYYEFTPLLLQNNNAGITSVVNPTSPLIIGSQNVEIALKNWGLNTLDSAIINWSVNGVLQTPYTYYGALASLQTTPVVIGSASFVSGNNDILAWTSLPNGAADSDVSNDTLSYSICSGLSGTYTIGGGASDYPSVVAAATDLANCGINGPVTFNIAAGTYTGAVVIPNVVGSSAVNTITFNGAGTSATTISHDGTGKYSTIQLNGADYVTFKNLTIANTGVANAWGVHLWNSADYNTIDSCIINLNNTATVSTIAGVISTNSETSLGTSGNNANYTTISNTVVNGGYYGIRFYGNTTASADNISNNITNCTINDNYYYGIYGYYQNNMDVYNSTVNFRSTTTNGYGINILYSKHSDVIGNYVNGAKTYGIYFLSENQTVSNPTMRSSVINNMVYALGAGDALYFSAGDDLDVFYNTFTAETDQALWFNNTSNNYDVKNNIFVSNIEPIDLDAVPGLTDVIDNNIYFNTSGGNIALVATPAYATLAAWQAADAVNNINSIQGNPLLIGSTNLHLQGTLADGVATPIASVTTDIDGEVRNATTPDIGADEFSPAVCFSPVSIVHTLLTDSTVFINWTSSGASNWILEYGISGFTQGSGTVIALTDTFTTITNLTPNTNYSYYVREYCGAADSSAWAGPFNFYTGYCLPSSSSALTYINNFSTSGGNVNISNLASGYTAGGYQDNYATHFVEVGAGTSFTYNYDFVGGSLGSAIWIDWNKNLIFEASEKVFNTTTYVTVPFTGSIPVALGQAFGDYRMRVMVDYNSVNPSNPCMTTNTRVEVEDYKITVVAQPTCFAPTALTANVITEDSAYLQWTSNTASAWVLEYGVDGFIHGTGTVLSLVDTFAGLSGLMPSTNYDYYVREYCAVGDSSAWAGPFSFYTGHCLPASSTADTYIAGFTTSSGNVNISNLASGFTAGGYQNNYATHFVEVGAGTSFDFNFTVVGGSLGAAIWIDWNNNLIFEASERVFNTTSYGFGPYSGSIPVSVAQTLGDYRMRVMVDYNNSNPTNPCMSGTRVEVEDYKITVVAPPTCFAPSALTATTTSYTSANLQWTSNTASAWVLEYGLNGFAHGAGTVVSLTDTFTTLSSLMANTNYSFYVREYCGGTDSSAWAGPVNFFTGACTPAPSSVDGSGIINVTMGTINNTTVAEVGNYGNYTALSTDAGQGVDFPVAITLNTGFGYTYNLFAFVDWNQDTDFNDANEQVYLGESPAISQTTFNAEIPIPANATLGSYVVRLGGSDSGLGTTIPTNPCYTGAYGTFEDYTLNIVACTNPTTTLSSAYCQGDTFTLPNGTDALSTGLYYDTLQLITGCDSVVIYDLTFNPISATTIGIEICEGDTFTLPAGLQVTTTGVYEEVLTNAIGCDSTVTYDVVVLLHSSASVSEHLCDGATLTLANNTVVSLANTYTVVIPNAAGCDSTITYNITTGVSSTATVNSNLCAGDSLLLADGSYMSTAGTSTIVIANAAGCDSTITYNLTLINPSFNTVDLLICQSANGYTLPGGTVVTASGTFVEVYANFVGCDSTVTYNITQNIATGSSNNIHLCDGDTYTLPNGDVVSTANTYIIYETNAAGCDSIVTFNITTGTSSTAAMNMAYCEGSSLVLEDGTVVTAPGTYTVTTTNTTGCDLVTTYTVTEIATVYGTQSATICEGEFFVFNNQVLTTAGTYDAVLTSAMACDSIVTLTLTVGMPTSATINASICEGDMYMFENQMLMQSGSYTFTTTNAAGCDSVITLNLTVNEAFSATVNATICSGDSYLFDGVSLTASGVYSANYTNAAGCDSITTLNLTVITATNETMTASICNGESYSFGTQILTTAGTYTEIFTNTAGCTYDVTLTLSVYNTVSTSEEIFLCGDITEATLANGTVVNAAGIYTATIPSSNGCDSVITYKVSTCVGVNDLTNAIAMSVYPNPTKDILNVVFTEKLDITNEIVITNAIGQVVYVISNVNSLSVELNTTTFADGVYYLTVTSGSNATHKTFTVVK